MKTKSFTKRILANISLFALMFSIAPPLNIEFTDSQVKVTTETRQAEALTIVDPSDISGLQVWLDGQAADAYWQTSDCTTTAATVATDTVQCWKDQSGNGYDVTETINPPTLADWDAGMTQLAVAFDGSLSQLLSNATMPTTGDFSYFVVFKADETPSTGTGMVFSGIDSSMSNIIKSQLYVDYANGTTPDSITFQNENSTSSTDVVPSDYTNNTVLASGSINSKAHNHVAVNLNGAPINPPSGNAAGSGRFSNASGYFLGQDDDGANFYTGQIAEVIFYDKRLNNREREAVETYLEGKWNDMAFTVTASPTPGGLDRNDLTLWLDSQEKYDGGEATYWFDLSGRNANFVRNTATTAFDTLANNSRLLKFGTQLVNGGLVTAYSSSGGILNNSNATDLNIFMVTKMTENTNAAGYAGTVFDQQMTTGNLSFSAPNATGEETTSVDFYADDASDPIQIADWSAVGGAFSTPELYTLTSQNGVGQEIFWNGQQVSSDATAATITEFASNQTFYLGTDSTGIQAEDHGFLGALGDFIIYLGDLTPAEQRRVESYLAVKFGLTLDVTSAGANLGYLDSTGAVTYAVNDTYNQDIAGMGQDDATRLSQTYAKSSNPTDKLTIWNPSDLQDGEFLIRGDNGADDSTAWTSVDIDASGYQRIAKEWYLEETGDVGTVDVRFNYTTLPSTSGICTISSDCYFYFVTDDDGVFDENSTYTLMTKSLPNFQATVDLTNAEPYFTIALGNPVTTVTPSGGAGNPLSVNELGATSDTYDIVLIEAPASDVTITIGGQGGQVTTDVPSLTFTPANYATPQTVTVTAIDDAVAESNPHSVTLTHTIGAGNGDSAEFYEGLNIAPVDVNIAEHDVTGPDVTVEQAVGQSDPTNINSATFTATFSEPITFGGATAADFTAADIARAGSGSVTSGPTEIAPNDGTTFSFTITGMTDPGTVTATIPAGGVEDLNGNLNNDSTSVDNNVTFDSSALAQPSNNTPADASYVTTQNPTLDASVMSGGTAPQTDAEWEVATDAAFTDVVWSRLASGAENSTSVTAGNGTFGGTLGGGATALADGTYYFHVRYTDTAPVTSSYSSATSFTVDSAKPNLDIDLATGQTDPTTSSPVVFQVTFTEPIDLATFVAGDVDTTGSTATLGTPVISEIAPNDGTTFEVSIPVTAATNDSVTMTIAAGDVSDPAGNTSNVPTITDNTVANVTILPNQAPSVAVDSVAQQADDGYVNIGYTITDNDDTDTCSLAKYQYSLNGTFSDAAAMTAAGGDAAHSGTSGLACLAGGSSYTFVWDAKTDADGQDLATVAVRLAANDGAVDSTDADSVAFVLDTLDPTLTSVSIASDNANDTTLAKAGDTVTLSFTADEALTADPVVTFSSGAAEVNGLITVANIAGNDWTADYTVDPLDPEGAVTFTIDFTDGMNNAGTQVNAVRDSTSVYVDLTAPADPAAAPDMTAGTDSGSSPTDNITNDTTPDFSGTCTDGNTITLYSDLAPVGTATCASSSFTINSDVLAEGSRSITFKEIDPAGNASADSPALNATIDTSAPAAPTVDSITDDTGDSASDEITNDDHLFFNGTAEANSTIEFYLDTIYQGVTTTDGVGDWSYDHTAVSISGPHNAVALAVDAAGNSSGDSSPLAIGVDLAPPTVAITPSANINATNVGSYDLSGTCSESSRTVTITVDDGNGVTPAVVATPTCTAGGAWTASGLDVSGLDDGTIDITADTDDLAGNTSTVPASDSVSKDTTAPALQSFTSTTADATYGPATLINVTATYDDNIAGGSTVDVTLDNGASLTLDQVAGTELSGTYTVGSTGSGEDSADLTVATIDAEAVVDGAGNTRSNSTLPAGQNIADTSNIIIDTSAPAVPTAVTLNTTDNTPNNVTGTWDNVEATVLSVNINGVTYVAGTDPELIPTGGTWTLDLSSAAALPEGANEVIVTTDDAAGNSSTDATTNEVTVDTVPPSLSSFTSTTIDGAYGPGATINITATYDDNLGGASTMDVTLDNGASLTLDQISGSDLSGTYTVGASGSGEDTSDLTVASIDSESVVDLAGNTRSDSTVPVAPNNIADTSNIVIDTSAPTITPANVTIDASGCSGTGGECLTGDTVTFQWDNSAGGDNNLDVTDVNNVDFDLSDFGGSTTAHPTDVGAGLLSFDYTVLAGIIDVTDATFTVTATDGNGNSAGPITSTDTAAVDNQAPTLTAGNTAVDASACTGTSGECIIGDTITFQWDNSATGDNNADVAIGDVDFDLSRIGGGAAVNPDTVLGGGVYSLDYVVVAGAIDVTAETFDVTVADDAGNAAGPVTSTDTVDVDSEAPIVTNACISVTGASGTSGEIIDGDTPVAEWDNSAVCDNNADTIASVSFDASEFETGATNVAATDTAGVWSTAAIANVDVIEASNRNVTVTVTDNAGNQAQVTDDDNYTIDTVVPVISEVTPIASPTSDNTPDYEFNTTEAGTMWYGGGTCSSDLAAAVMGDNTMTLYADGVSTPLTDGTYTNASNACEFTVTDAAGNESTGLTPADFTVDTTAPTVTPVTVVPDPTNDSTPSYTFNSDEVGTISYGGSCNSTDTTAASGDNTVTLDADGLGGALADATYNDCTVTVTDAAGNANAAIAITAFTVDTQAPTVTEVTAVPDPTNDSTPSYTFNTDEAGAISYGGSCNSADTTASVGGNTVTLDADGLGGALADATYNDCTVTVTDDAGNSNVALAITAFTVDTGQPSATISYAGADPTNTSPMTFDILFNEAVTGLAAGDFTVTNGTAANLTGSGDTYAVEVTPTDDGNVSIQLPATSVQDAATNDNTVSNLVTVAYDGTAPTVTITNPGTINALNSTSFDLDGTCTENGETVTIDVFKGTSHITIPAQPTCTASAWNLTVNPSSLSDGTITVTADQDDVAGNSAIQASRAVTKDTSAAAVVVSTAANITSANVASYGASGTCSENGEEVTVTITDGTNNATIGTQPTCAAGAWSVSGINVSGLNEGNNNISVKADHSDSSGNAANTATKVISKDTVAPTVTVDSLNTNDTTPTLIGAVNDNGATVSITVDGQVRAATNNGDGTWTLADTISPALADGTYDVAVTATDSRSNAGNDATTNELFVDGTAPSGLTALTPGATGNTDQVLNWTAVTEANFDHYEIWYGTNQTNVQTRTGANVWNGGDDAAMDNISTTTTTITGLTEGTTYYFEIWAVDTVGNEETVADINTTTTGVDATAPTIVAITRLTPIAANTNATDVTFQVEFSEDVQNVDATDFSLSGTASGTLGVVNPVSAVYYEVPVTGVSGDGTLNLDIAGGQDITDIATNPFDGVTIGSEQEYTIDNTDPTITITAPVNALESNYDAYDIAGTCSTNGDSVAITFNDANSATLDDATASATCTAGGNWSTTAVNLSALIDGNVDVDVVITDPAGNTASASDSFTKDVVIPTVTVDTLSTTDTTPELTGTVNDETASVIVTVNSVAHAATNNANGTWTLADDTIATALATGTYDVSVTATDAAGNVGTDSSTNELTVSEPPAAATSGGGGGVVVFAGSGGAGSKGPQKKIPTWVDKEVNAETGEVIGSESAGSESVGEFTFASEKNQFADVPETHWAYKYAEFLNNMRLGTDEEPVIQGYTVGGTEGRIVGPEETLKRFEVAKIALMVNGKEIKNEISENGHSFKDFGRKMSGYANEDEVRRIIYTAYDEGIINGYATGYVDPFGPVTRAEAIKILVAASGVDISEYQADKTSRVSGVSVDEWYYPYVAYAYENDMLLDEYLKDVRDFKPAEPFIRGLTMELAIKLITKSIYIDDSVKEMVIKNFDF